MCRTIATCALLVATTVPSLVHADSYRPFRDFRQVDPTGRFYVVVKKNGGPEDPGEGTPVTFEFAERRPASPPVFSAVSGGSDGAIVPNTEVRVRERDVLLGRGSLERCPREILISSTGLGFVGLDVRGYNYGDLRKNDAVVIVSRDGTVRHRKALIDLFSEKEVERFRHTAGGVFWCGGGWIDETRKEVIVLGDRGWPEEKPIPQLFRSVNMETGTVRHVSSDCY
jgi:hypothetical protein